MKYARLKQFKCKCVFWFWRLDLVWPLLIRFGKLDLCKSILCRCNRQSTRLRNGPCGNITLAQLMGSHSAGRHSWPAKTCEWHQDQDDSFGGLESPSMPTKQLLLWSVEMTVATVVVVSYFDWHNWLKMHPKYPLVSGQLARQAKGHSKEWMNIALSSGCLHLSLPWMKLVEIWIWNFLLHSVFIVSIVLLTLPQTLK